MLAHDSRLTAGDCRPGGNPQNVYVNRIVGTSTSVAIEAERAPAPPLPLGALTLKRTRMVSSVQVMLPVGAKFGHGVVPGHDEKLTAPPAPFHCVTAPASPTVSSSPLTRPLPSPIVPLTDTGGVAVAF